MSGFLTSRARKRAARLAGSMQHVVACLGVLLAGCGTAVYENQIRVSLLETPARCGKPPWAVLAFPTHRDYSGDAEWAQQRTGSTSSAEPYVVEVSSMEVRWIGDSTPPTSVPVGLYVPCVRTDGYWSVDVVPRLDAPTTADARFCPWGTLIPAADAETLRVTTTSTRGAHRAWVLDIRMDLSSTEREPEPEEAPPAPRSL